jgi:hypothetical protein
VEAKGRAMIDDFALGLTHALMLVAAWRLLRRPDLDGEGGPAPRRFGQRPRA